MSRFLLLLVVCSLAPARGAEADSHCPTEQSLENNLTYNVASMDRKYMGYIDDPSKTLVGFFGNTSTKNYRFDWAFEKCPGTSKYLMKAGTRDGPTVYLHCCVVTHVCSLGRASCSDWPSNSFQLQPLGSRCGLNPPAFGANWYLCDLSFPLPVLPAVAGVCLGMSAASEVSLLPASCEPVTNTSGKWVPLSFSNTENEYSLEVGVDHSYSHEFSMKWGASASADIGAGFSVEKEGAGGEGKVSVSPEVSVSYAKSWKQTLTMEKTEKHSYHLGPGTFWQFQFVFEDRCGRSTAGGKDYVLTQGEPANPCCLPGYFVDNSKPHGDCLKASDGKIYSFCEQQRDPESPVAV